MKQKLYLTLLLGLLFSPLAKAQEFAIKSNLLYDATATVNLGVEFGLAPKWSLDLSGNFNSWQIKESSTWKHWMVQPEARYWFCDRFSRSFLGFHALAGQFNFGGIDNGINFLGSDFYPVDDAYWQQSSNGRMFIFKPTNVVSEYGTGHYHLYLKTNSSNSADVVRVASNKVGSPSGIPANAGAEYDGNTYRAFIFELKNYRPFRFAAQISASGGEPQGTWGEGQVDAEPVDEVSWTYEPEQQIDIMFDVTSFAGSDGGSPDPFGVPFEIYIDAPMLRIDKSRLAECNLNSSKLVASPDVKGRFIYYVDSSREVERTFGSGEGVKYIDTTGADQTGERKRLPFITTGITSAGEIKLSSNHQKVIFYDKIFEVSNSLIEGNIQYLDQSTYRDVPKDAFVSFALRSTGVRIGSMNITSDGHYKLNLRGEYEFDWVDDELELDYILTDRVYTAYIDNLATLYDMAERGQTITLEYIE